MRWPRSWPSRERSTCRSTTSSRASPSPPPGRSTRELHSRPMTGRLRTLADSRRPGSVGDRFRQRRFVMFRELVDSLPGRIRILDVGGTTDFWERVGYAGHDRVEVVLVNLIEQSAPHDNISAQVGDATDLSRFADDEFEVAVSNSVIEHLPTLELQARMAA